MEQIIHVADNTTIIKQNTSIAKKKRKISISTKKNVKNPTNIFLMKKEMKRNIFNQSLVNRKSVKSSIVC